MKPDEIDNAYYKIGALNSRNKVETPHITGGTVYFEIRCHVCHTGLCKLMTIAKTDDGRRNMIFVMPCPECVQAASEGREVNVVPLDNRWKEIKT